MSGTANNKHRAIISRMFMRCIKTGDFHAIHKAFTGMGTLPYMLAMHAGGSTLAAVALRMPCPFLMLQTWAVTRGRCWAGCMLRGSRVAGESVSAWGGGRGCRRILQCKSGRPEYLAHALCPCRMGRHSHWPRGRVQHQWA